MLYMRTSIVLRAERNDEEERDRPVGRHIFLCARVRVCCERARVRVSERERESVCVCVCRRFASSGLT